MAQRIMEFWWNLVDRQYQDALGTPINLQQYPWIIYKEKPMARLHLVTDTSNTPYGGLSAAYTYQAAVDDDFDHASVVMCKTLNADINVPSDWGSIAPAAGRFAIRLDADTATFDTALGTEQERRACWFELQGFEDGTGDIIFVAQMPFRCYNLVDDGGAVPPEPTEDYYIKAESDARYASKTYWEHFTDGEGNHCARIRNDLGTILAEFKPPGV